MGAAAESTESTERATPVLHVSTVANRRTPA